MKERFASTGLISAHIDCLVYDRISELRRSYLLKRDQAKSASKCQKLSELIFFLITYHLNIHKYISIFTNIVMNHEITNYFLTYHNQSLQECQFLKTKTTNIMMIKLFLTHSPANKNCILNPESGRPLLIVLFLIFSRIRVNLFFIGSYRLIKLYLST